MMVLGLLKHLVVYFLFNAAILAFVFLDKYHNIPLYLRHIGLPLLFLCPSYILVQFFFFRKYDRFFVHNIGVAYTRWDGDEDAVACFIYLGIAGIVFWIANSIWGLVG